MKETAKNFGILSAAIAASVSGHYSPVQAQTKDDESRAVASARAVNCIPATEMTVPEFNMAMASYQEGDPKLFVLGVNSTNGLLVVGMEDKAGQVRASQIPTLVGCGQTMGW